MGAGGTDLTVNGLLSVNGTIDNQAVITSSTATTFNINSIYIHNQDGGTIPAATYSAGSLLRVTGITGTVATLPAANLNGNIEWNCPGQTDTDIFLGIADGQTQTIGGNFTLVSTGSGAITQGGTSNRSLNISGNVDIQGGSWYLVGLTGTPDNPTTNTISGNLSISGGNFVALGGANTSGTGSGGTGTGTITVNGNASISGTGSLRLSTATSNGTACNFNLKGNLSISGTAVITKTAFPATGPFNFNGTTLQTYSKTGGTISGQLNFAIASNAIVDFGTSLLDGMVRLSL